MADPAHCRSREISPADISREKMGPKNFIETFLIIFSELRKPTWRIFVKGMALGSFIGIIIPVFSIALLQSFSIADLTFSQEEINSRQVLLRKNSENSILSGKIFKISIDNDNLKKENADLLQKISLILPKTENNLNQCHKDLTSLKNDINQMQSTYKNQDFLYKEINDKLSKCNSQIIVKNEISVNECSTNAIYDFSQYTREGLYIKLNGFGGWSYGGNSLRVNFEKWVKKGTNKGVASLSFSDNGQILNYNFDEGRDLCAILPSAIIKLRVEFYDIDSDSVYITYSTKKNNYRKE